MYNKIYKSMLRLCLFILITILTVVLAAVYVILSITAHHDNPTLPFLYILGAALFFSAVLFYISSTISHKLTQSILNPIVNINLSDPNNAQITTYPELAAIIKKITAQDSEIKRQLIKLQTRKTRFQAVSENISEGLLTLDTQGNVLSVNRSGSIILGRNEDDILHIKLTEIVDNPEISGKLQAAYLGKKEFLTISLNNKHYNMFFSPVFENNEVRGIVVLILDISERLQSEEIRQEFSANVSHELKTPLTTILGYSQIINRGIAKPEDIMGFSKKIEKEASRLITLIDDIIKLSKLDEHAPVAEPQPIHMLSVVSDVTESLMPNAQNKNVQIDVIGADFVITGNLPQITELVYNLCDNAIKYNKDGGLVKIILNSNSITFADTGIGIPAEYCDRIFERFFRVDKSRSKSVNGTGLGLSIVKHIAERHNATISVESKPDEGTRIKVEF